MQPDFFPSFVGFEKLSVIEERDAVLEGLLFLDVFV